MKSSVWKKVCKFLAHPAGNERLLQDSEDCLQQQQQMLGCIWRRVAQALRDMLQDDARWLRQGEPPPICPCVMHMKVEYSCSYLVTRKCIAIIR